MKRLDRKLSNILSFRMEGPIVVQTTLQKNANEQASKLVGESAQPYFEICQGSRHEDWSPRFRGQGNADANSENPLLIKISSLSN